jgi:hypothetical protein
MWDKLDISLGLGSLIMELLLNGSTCLGSTIGKCGSLQNNFGFTLIAFNEENTSMTYRLLPTFHSKECIHMYLKYRSMCVKL